MDLVMKLYERHCNGDDLCGEAQKTMERLEARVVELEGALRDMFALIDDGFLCRDISRDAEPGWSIKMLGFVQRLAKNKQALKD